MEVAYTQESALQIHDAFAPWETSKSSFLQFAWVVGVSVIVSTVVGAILEIILSKWQRSQSRLACGSWLLVQISMNVALLYVTFKYIYNEFVPYLLMTVAGFAFAVMLFSSQNSLGSNAICLLKF